MSRFALKTIAVTAASVGVMVGAVSMLNGGAFAQDAFDLSVPKPGEETAPEADLECGPESISGSGPGFTDDRDKAEAMAIDDWTEKAKKVFPDADFDLSKDENLSCAVQGLFSKCFADGIPCRPKAE